MSRASVRVPITARRRLLGTTGAMLLLSAAAAGSAKAKELDGELLACCAAAEDADERVRAIDDQVGDLLPSDPRWEDSHAEVLAIMVAFRSDVQRATELPARTPEGLRAKASLALRELSNSGVDFPLVASLLRDVAGRAG